MDELRVVAAFDDMGNVVRINGDGSVATNSDAPDDSRVVTFWKFRRQQVPGAGEILSPRFFSASTATVITHSWGILNREARQVVTVARNRELSLKAAKLMAPNLAHWSKDVDLQELLDLCSPSGEPDEGGMTNLDRLGRRKQIPVTRFVDKLMAIRLGLADSTVSSYRERQARISRKKSKKGRQF